MKRPYIDHMSDLSAFAEFARYVAEIPKQYGNSAIEHGYSYGRMRAASDHLASIMEAAIQWQEREREEVREISQKRRSNRR